MSIHDVLHKTPLITYSGYYKEAKKKNKENPLIIENWLYLEEHDEYICLLIALFLSKDTAEEKIKAGLREISKCMNVKIVGNILFVANVPEPRAERRGDKFS